MRSSRRLQIKSKRSSKRSSRRPGLVKMDKSFSPMTIAAAKRFYKNNSQKRLYMKDDIEKGKLQKYLKFKFTGDLSSIEGKKRKTIRNWLETNSTTPYSNPKNGNKMFFLDGVYNNDNDDKSSVIRGMSLQICKNPKNILCNNCLNGTKIYYKK